MGGSDREDLGRFGERMVWGMIRVEARIRVPWVVFPEVCLPTARWLMTSELTLPLPCLCSVRVTLACVGPEGGDGESLSSQVLVLGMRNEPAIQKSSLIPLTPVRRGPRDLSDVRVKYLGGQRQTRITVYSCTGHTLHKYSSPES